MRWTSAAARVWALLGAACCLILLAVALIGGDWRPGLVALGSAVWWLLLHRYWSKRARAARRHRDLREQRLDRERRGLAPPRG